MKILKTQRRKTMKKFLTLTLVVLALVFVLASCGKDTPTQPTIPTTTQPQGTEPPAHEHDYETIVTDPTCTEQGVVLYICACGDKYTEYIDALGHIESDWIIDVEATTTQEGSKHTECTVCGQPIKTETIDKLPSTTSEGLEFTLNDDGQSYSVTGIGTCTDTDIVIPSEYNGLPVIGIGEYAFEDCKSLTSIELGNSVTSIGEYAFRECTSLVSTTIPESVTNIGDYAFFMCTSLTSIDVEENNKYYKSIDGNLYTIDGTILIQYAMGKEETSFTIPNSVTSIGSAAFNSCTTLTSITIPNSVTSIGSTAFSDCTSLTSVTIGNFVMSIDQFAFYGCTSLTSITIPNAVTRIGNDAFANCFSLIEVINKSSLNIKAGSSSYGYVGYYAKHIITDESQSALKTLGDYIIYDDGTEVYLVKYIGNNREITLPEYDGGKEYGIWQRVFRGNDEITSVTIPDSVTNIGDSAFANCSSLTSVTIGNSVTSIGYGAFNDCISLTRITIGNSVTSIGNYAFSNCPIQTANIPTSAISSMPKGRLVTVTITGGSTIGEKAFNNFTSLISVTIGNSVTSIAARAFYNCTSLASITIPDSVTSIGDYAFSSCISLKDVYYTGTVEGWLGISFGDSSSSPMYNGANLYFEGKLVTNLLIPDSVTSIGDYAFWKCISLTSITISDSVTSIGNHAFGGCNSLIEVINKSSLNIIAGSSDNGRVGSYAKHIIINESESALKTIGDYVFYDDGTEVYLVKYIGNDAEITLPEYDGGKEYGIWEHAFYSNNKITSVTIPDSVMSIGQFAFSDCTSLTSAFIPDSVMSIGKYAFQICPSLTIYCEATSKPSSWNSNWNNSNRPVVWGYKPE